MGNVSGLESLLKALEALVDEAEGRRTKWRDVWSEIKNIGQEFKKVRFPTAQERQEAWDRFQSRKGTAIQSTLFVKHGFTFSAFSI